MKPAIVIFILMFVFSFKSVSQRQTTYRSEVFGSVATGDNTPFWMLYHNWGMVPLDANNFYVRGGVFHQQTIDKDWSFNAGFDLAGSSPSAYEKIWVQQFYGELNWKFLRLNAGSKEDYVSFLNPCLSSGDFNTSNNARPFPEIKVSLPNFILFPYTKGNMYIKGDFAVGYYLDGKWQKSIAHPYNQSYTKDVMIHHKSIYFRLGNIEERNRLQFTFGMDHQALYGGELYHSRYSWETGQYDYTVQKQPRGIEDLWRVAIGKEGSPSSSGADRAYVAGSSTGVYLFKFDYLLKNRNTVSVYKQHFFEDGSGMALENYRDGLYGIEYKSKNKSLLSGAVFEFVYTKNQTGPIHFNLDMDDEHSHLRSKGNGNDSYYNNGDYVQGPSYFGRTRGTPLFLSPEYNKNGKLNFTSSRIIALHLGIEGYFHSNLQYRLLATTGQSWGLYYVPFTSVAKGFASKLDLTYTFPKSNDLDLKLSLGFNKGEFFSDDSFGGGITITKRGILFQR
jgi:hypothetical protein